MRDDFRQIRFNEAIRARSGPDWSWQSGNLPDYDIWLPFEGEGSIDHAGISYEAARGDCFFLRRGCSYIADQKPGSQLKCLGIHLDFLDSDGKPTDPETIPSFKINLTNIDIIVSLAERAVDAWRRDNPKQRDLRALQIWGQALFEELVTQDLQTRETGVWRGQRIVLERMCRAFYEFPDKIPSLTQLAEQMNCSRWTFCRIFKEHLGTTPQDYILRAKIAASRSFLETTNLNAKEIASRLGYTDASHFNKHFKRHTGFTPIEYRKRTRP